MIQNAVGQKIVQIFITMDTGKGLVGGEFLVRDYRRRQVTGGHATHTSAGRLVLDLLIGGIVLMLLVNHTAGVMIGDNAMTADVAEVIGDRPADSIMGRVRHCGRRRRELATKVAKGSQPKRSGFYPTPIGPGFLRHHKSRSPIMSRLGSEIWLSMNTQRFISIPMSPYHARI